MAKIGKDVFVIKNENICVEIHYSPKTGFYYKDVPQEVYDLTGFGNKRYPDEESLKQHLLCSLTEYHEKIRNCRKVISYHLYGSAQLILNKLEGIYAGYSGIKTGISKQFDYKLDNNIENMFGFTFNILMEVAGRTTEYYHVREDYTPGGLYRLAGQSKEMIIDWTQERKQFFMDLREKLQQLIYGVSEFSINRIYFN
ncbi:hypothetical protein DW228_06705 [Bacteroides fragilis]|uniref:Uncharacterized protein n=1 Tax=Bacteroides fragilis TaxID=817 RepID=A0A396C714_BACFG|nr:hypothetical protein [Bacteroides fragilis]RHH14484.1 hypothetical protein DW228_06705 [Bacteroides fragilis]